MKTKYDWPGVPSWVNWIATDKRGMICGFENKPMQDSVLCIWRDGSISNYMQLLIRSYSHAGNWKDSLEERPNENT